MRIGIVLTLLVAFTFTSFAQKKGQKAAVRDSVAFFYASIELNNGLSVVTPIDSIKTSANEMAKSLFQVNSANRLRILKFAQTTLKDRTLRIKNDQVVIVLSSKPTLKALQGDLDRFLNVNKGSVYNLDKYKFIKPTDSGEESPFGKVTVH
ncbi:hypothetical protein [Roseivirga misakiensis]|uniref:DUF4252 domain-containing protein n=1 Tax=Roseivirga misakiensis TaxID=1563681 RepID=A0A1E5T2T1_9BACT|nr:hypothetical protein [Roseivirga misakiensis]OEK05679.1 hypothetical protein BFP71_06030 [Roseivirga misakiensis]